MSGNSGKRTDSSEPGPGRQQRDTVMTMTAAVMHRKESDAAEAIDVSRSLIENLVTTTNAHRYATLARASGEHPSVSLF
jgi:hypothetical protein